MCELQRFVCVDCESVVSCSFVLVAQDGHTTAFMLVAVCKTCHNGGDARSLRTFQEAPSEGLTFALAHNLPLFLLR